MTDDWKNTRLARFVRRRDRSLLVRAVYAACLLGATFNHGRILVQHGLFWDYGGVPVASAVFWTSLAALDPLAAVMLFVRPNAGVAATGVIIVADVTHNLWMTARYALPRRFLDAVLTDPLVVSQVAFMLFVATTVPAAWKRAQRPSGQ